MEKIDIKKITNTILNKKIYIINVVIIFIILGCLYTFAIVKEKYKSSTTLIMGRTSFISAEVDSEEKTTAQAVQSEMQIDSRAISTYSELIKSNTSIEEIKKSLRLDMSNEQVKDSIKVSRVAKTDIVEITVEHENKKIATDIANKAAEVFSKKIKEIYKISEIYVIDSAISSEAPYNAHHIKHILISVILGIALSMGYVVILSVTDTTIESSETIEKEIGLKTLVSIPNKKRKNEKLIQVQNEKTLVVEAFKELRKNVQFINIHNKTNKVMLITSCFSAEGKSYVAANLATVFAEAGKKVILIDMDMRRGGQSGIFNIPNQLGISNYLSNIDANGMEINERINSYIKETSIKNLNVITSGSVPPNPSDLLSSEKLPELIKDLSVFYDIIMIDGAPVLPVTDSLVLSGMSGSTILVSCANKTKKEELKKAKRDLQNVGARVIGVVLTQATIKEKEIPKTYIKNKIKSEIKSEEIKSEKNLTKKNHIKNKVIKIKEWISNYVAMHKRKQQLLLEQSKDNTEVTEKNSTDDKKNIENNKVLVEEKTNLKDKTKKEKEQNKEDKKVAEQTEIKNEKESENLQGKINKEEINNYKEINEVNKKIDENIIEYLNEDLENNISSSKYKQIIKKVSEKVSEQKDKIILVIKGFPEKAKKVPENIKTSFGNIKEKAKEYKAKKNIEKSEKQKIKEQEIKQKEILESEELVEQEKEEAILAEIREQEKMEKERIVQEEKLQKELLKKELKDKKQQEKEEKRKFKEQKRRKQKEEARIQEELLEDNLYPKTKYNKNL